MPSHKLTWKFAFVLCGVLLAFQTPAQTPPAQTEVAPPKPKPVPVKPPATAAKPVVKPPATQPAAAAKTATNPTTNTTAAAKTTTNPAAKTSANATAPTSTTPPGRTPLNGSPAPAGKTATPTSAAVPATRTSPAATNSAVPNNNSVPLRNAGTSAVAPVATNPTANNLTNGVTSAAPTTAASSNNLVAQPTSAASSVATAQDSGGSRGGLGTQGVGTFQGLDYTLTAYACYRSGDRVLCDFDLTKQNGAQVNVGPFNDVSVVDSGGRITRRHDAYYMDTDGSRMPAAFVSPTPVRYIMEFDNVPAQATSISLIHGGNRIQNVPITTAPTAPAAQQAPPQQ